MSKKYANHSSAFKFKVALEALKGELTVTELCQKFKLSSGQIYEWKKTLEKSGAEIFLSRKKKAENETDIEKLHATIGKLKVECDFLSKALGR